MMAKKKEKNHMRTISEEQVLLKVENSAEPLLHLGGEQSDLSKINVKPVSLPHHTQVDKEAGEEGETVLRGMTEGSLGYLEGSWAPQPEFGRQQHKNS